MSTKPSAMSSPVTSVEVDEADLVDQHTTTGSDEPADPRGPATDGGEVDEADRLDQATPLSGDDEDDYPREQIAADDL